VVAHKYDGEIGMAPEHAAKVSLKGVVDEFEVLAIRVRCKELRIAEQRPSLRRRQACVWCRRAIVLVAAIVVVFVGNRGQRWRILLEETVGVFLLRRNGRVSGRMRQRERVSAFGTQHQMQPLGLRRSTGDPPSFKDQDKILHNGT
jgi:hypothetical protein